MFTLMLLVALGFGFLQTGPGRDLVRGVAVDALNGIFRGRFEVDSLSGFLPFDARLEGVRLYAPDGTLIAKLGAVQTEFAPFDLFDTTVALSNLVVEKPEVTLFDVRGDLLWARALQLREPPIDDTPSPWVVKIAGASLDRGSLENLVPMTDLGLQDLSVDLALALTPDALSWPKLELHAVSRGDSALAHILGGTITLATSGRLVADRVELDGFNISAGPHALEVLGTLELGSKVSGHLDVARITFDLNRLPTHIAERLGSLPLSPSLVTGDGRATLDADSWMTAELKLDTPLGWISINSENALQMPHVAGNPWLGEWHFEANLLDIKPTEGMLAKLPEDLTELRTDVTLEARGLGWPRRRPVDGGRLAVDLDLVERHPTRSGHLRLALEQVLEDAKGVSFETSLELQDVRLHPWLELFGETDLRVDLPHLMSRARIDWPESGPPSVVAMATLDVAAEGVIRALKPPRPVKLEETAGSIHLRWNGSGWPTGRIEFDGSRFELWQGKAESLRIAMELTEEDGRHHLGGSIRAKKAQWGDFSVESLEVPASVFLESGLDGLAPLENLGTVGLRASWFRTVGLELGGMATTLRIDTDEDGLRLSGPLSLVDFSQGREFELARSDLRVDLKVPDSLWHATSSPRPVRVGVDGKASGLRKGPFAADEVDFESFELKVPVTPGGISGAVGATGRLALSHASAFGVSAEAVTLDAMAQLFLPTLSLSGSSTLELQQTKLPRGEILERTLVTLRGLGDAVGFEAVVTEGPKQTRRRNEARFKGSLKLPLRARPVEVELESLSLGAPDESPWLILERGLLDGEGWISAEQIRLRSPYDSGQLVASGRFQPSSRRLELKASSSKLALSAWRDHARDLLPLLSDPTSVSSAIPNDDIHGNLSLDLELGGSLDALDIRGGFELSDVSYRTLPRSNISAHIETKDGNIVLESTAQWGETGNMKLGVTFPLAISVGAKVLEWDEDRPMQLSLTLLEPDMKRLVGITGGLAGMVTPTDLDGNLDLAIKVGGTPRSPTMSVALYAKEFVFGETWRDGTLTVDGSARYEATGFRVELLDSNDEPQIQLDAQLPFAMPRLLVEPDPFGWARSRLENRSFLVELDLPPVAVGDTPFAPLWPDSLEDLRTRVDLTVGGTLIFPSVEGLIQVGKVENVEKVDKAEKVESAPTDLAFSMAIATGNESVVEAKLDVSQGSGRKIATGGLTLPSLAAIIREPQNIGAILRDSRFAVQLDSAELRAFELWELEPGLGDLLRRMFPDGIFQAGLRASGGQEGLVAVLQGKVRTSKEGSVRVNSATADNIADRVDISVELAKSLDLRVDINQTRSDKASSLRLDGTLGLSAEKLVSGEADLDALVIKRGLLRADRFRLEGLASSFRAILGGSGGELNGEIGISGTTRNPSFSNGLCAQFEPLDVVPLGLEHDRLALNLGFEEGLRWWATKTERCLESSRPHPVRKGCELDEPSLDDGTGDWRETGFGLSLSGNIPSFNPGEMSLEGCLRLENYQALDTKDLKGRIDANIDLTGTIARPSIEGEIKVVSARLAPNLASRNVRPIGLPLDVHLVKGEPMPREKRVEAVKGTSPLNLDVAIYLPRDAVRIEPSMTLPLGEVRANLYPFTGVTQGLWVRMKDGVLSLIGTIEVPKETVTIYGKNFTVDEDSRVVFRGNMASDPQLFFTARHNISYVDLSSLGLATNNESEVVVRVTGTPMKPRLAFSSSPAMDETNILSVVALGVPAGGGAGLGEAVQSQLLTAMMGMATLQFARDFQRRLALDIMRVEARSLDPRDTRLTVGKRLTRDLTLYYDLDPSAREGEDVNAGSLEYRVTRFLSLLARAGDSNDVGLELNLRFQDSPPRNVAPADIK